METVINNPGGSSEGSGAGAIIGVLIAIIIVVLFIIYGLPAIRNRSAGDNGSIDVNVQLPTNNDSNGSAGGSTPPPSNPSLY